MITISQKARYVFVLILLIMWFRDRFHKKITLYTSISVGISILLNISINRFYFKPRPFVKLLVHLLPPAPSKKNSSFPSKHTALAFAAATTVIFYKRGLGYSMYILAFLAGLSRIWVGQHYPSDIAGSALLGSLSGIMVKISERVWNPYIEKVIQIYPRYCSMLKNKLLREFLKF
jgi:undecaprenyl-diphosphatase